MNKINERDIPFILKHSFVREEFDPEIIKEIGNMFVSSSRVNIFIESKSFDKQCQIFEQWMLTKFNIEDISGDLLKAIENQKPELKNKPLDFPVANNLLPKKFDIVPEDKEMS